MKKFIAIALLVSFNAFCGSDSCPMNQGLESANEYFQISIKAKKDLQGGIDLSEGKSAVYNDSPLMTLASHSNNLNIKKDSLLKVVFIKPDFYQFGNDQDRSISGVIQVGDSLERVDFIINDRIRQEPTLKDLEAVLGDSFSIDCIKRELSSQSSSNKESTSSHQ